LKIVSVTIALTDEKIDLTAALALAQSERAGAVDVFIGTVRNHADGKRVLRLEYEAYDQMALKKMNQIAEQARQQWPIEALVMVHRKGPLDIGDVAVVVAVATAHRAAAFEACRWLIDTLKQHVPIWKKEIYEDGSVWVAAHA
jgi:molybdopterin synthase catalytic subunit